MRELTVDDVERALYEERSLVKPMAMRRTLFVVTRDLLPAVAGCAGRRVAEVERRRLAKEAAELEAAAGARLDRGGIDDSRGVPDRAGAVGPGAARRTAQPRGDVHRGARDEVVGGGADHLAAPDDPHRRRDVVRAHNASHWRISRPLWTSMASWLGEELTPTEPEAGYAEVVRHWLWTFGPGDGGRSRVVARVDEDRRPHGAGRRRRSRGRCSTDGSTGWVLPDDTADLEAPPETEPWVALLPTLDPTTMGWRERAFYLDPAHTPFLFDSAGNGGTTVWVDGRIVGCWVQDDAERVRLVLIEEISPDARRRLDAEAARLDEFLGGEHITNVFASPQMKHKRIR